MNFLDMLNDKIADFFETEKYAFNPEAPELSPERLFALNVGAINAEQTSFFTNSLTTGQDVDALREKLEENYGVTDEESFASTLQWFLHQGHRMDFEFGVKPLLAGQSIDFPEDMTEEEKAAVQEEMSDYVTNLHECTEELKDVHLIAKPEDFLTADIFAWDFGRCIVVVRSAYDCGFVSEEDAWEIIEVIGRAAGKHYVSWKDLAAGYLIGRAMWSGSGVMLTGLISIAEGLLEDEDSPWTKIPFMINEAEDYDEAEDDEEVDPSAR